MALAADRRVALCRSPPPALALALALVVCLAAAASAGGAAAGGAAAGVTLIAQVSDLHLSAYGRPDAASDLLALAAGPLAAWALAPRALVLTGDLTDGKRPSAATQQEPAEWEAFASLSRLLTARLWPHGHGSGGGGGAVDQQQSGRPLLAVPGNHDAFDAPRGSARDLYSAGRPTKSRVQLEWVRAGAGGGGGSAAGGAAGAATCAPLLLLGLDLVPASGLRSPTNFFGVAPAWLLAEAHAALGAALGGADARGCARPAIVAFGHYPPSTIAYPDRSLADWAAAALSAVAGRTRGARLLLLAWCPATPRLAAARADP
jgi:hypothetical protein